MSTGKRVTKNFLSLSAAEIFTRIGGILLTIYIARTLGVGSFGQLAFATAFISYLNIFADFGLTTLGIREIAKDKVRAGFFASHILALQFLISVTLLIFLAVALVLLPLDSQLKLLTFLFGLGIIPGAFNLSYILQAYEKMDLVALARVASQIIYLMLGFLLIYLLRDVLVLPVVSLVATVAVSGIIFYQLRRQVSIVWESVNLRQTLGFMRLAWPFLISGLAVQIYYNADAILLQFMKDSETVGLYSAGYKLIMLGVTVIGLITSTVYPLLSSTFATDREFFQKILGHLSKISGLLAWPIFVGGLILAGPIINFLYGSPYLQSVEPFQILLFLIPMLFFNGILGVATLAIGDQKRNTLAAVVGAGSNISLNIILIPVFGMVGAAVTSVVAEVLVLATLTYFYLPKSSIINISYLMRSYVAKPIPAAFVMGLVLWWLKGLVSSLLLLIPISAVVYLLVLTLTKGIDRHDLTELKKILSRG